MADPNANTAALAKTLKEGESISRSIRIPASELRNNSPRKRISKLRNSMNQVAARTRDITGFTYTVESGSFLNHDESAIIATVVLTCTRDEGEDDI